MPLQSRYRTRRPFRATQAAGKPQAAVVAGVSCQDDFAAMRPAQVSGNKRPGGGAEVASHLQGIALGGATSKAAFYRAAPGVNAPGGRGASSRNYPARSLQRTSAEDSARPAASLADGKVELRKHARGGPRPWPR